MKRAYLLSSQLLDAQLQDFGLGRTQWQIMFHLAHEGSVSQRVLQKKLHVESATLTNLVASLVRKGWIQQLPDPKDKRSKYLQLTPRGKEVWKTLPDPLRAIQDKMTQGIPRADIEQARQVLMRVVENLEQD